MSASDPLNIIEFTRYFLAFFFTFVALFYTTRIFLKKRATTRGFVFPGQKFGTTWWNHMSFRFFRFAIWMVCLNRLFFPSLDNYLGLIIPFQTFSVILMGNILIATGFLFTLFNHFWLGRNWTSGIDPGGPEKVVTSGFYKYSRNPMFAGIILAQLGFFLALPSVFSLACLVIGAAAIYRQAISEEQHLETHFPSEYAVYRSNVRRWI